MAPAIGNDGLMLSGVAAALSPRTPNWPERHGMQQEQEMCRTGECRWSPASLSAAQRAKSAETAPPSTTFQRADAAAVMP
ncbi:MULTISPECIES: hypothetical protein [unclassified Methylosinus]|uniref:hypothetical protein n=1 Tax=unclassified Methylosinus TaxID=2624500 RepID=UPI000A432BCB|nr:MULTISPECIES: hypothetical protein [unclassified Methylosinus]